MHLTNYELKTTRTNAVSDGEERQDFGERGQLCPRKLRKIGDFTV